MPDTLTIEPDAIRDLLRALNKLTGQLAAIHQGFAPTAPLNCPEAARYLGMHPQTLRKLVAARVIPCERVGHHLKFRMRDLDAYRTSQHKRR